MPNDASRDRPDELDRLLRSAMPGTLEPASPSCVDAETMAAWSEGALSAKAAAAVESHLSRCVRCQAIAAAFAEAAPEPAASAVVPFRPRRALRWIVPVASAAALVVLWVVVQRDDRSPLPAQTMARMEPADAAGPGTSAGAPAASEAPQGRTDSRRQAEAPAEQKSAAPQAAARARGLDDAAVAMESAEGEVAREQRAETVDGLAATPAPSSVAARSVADRAPTSPPAAEAAQERAGGGLDGSRAMTGEAARAADPESARVASAVPSPPVVIAVTPEQSTVADGRLAEASRDEAPPAPTPSPVRWRIVEDHQVERSTAGGAWEQVFADPSATLTGGFAPSAAVCWLIGRDGLVLVAADGLRFERVGVPTTADLSSIRAVDARRATVTTVDGRVFTTADGGASWQAN